ncbi:MAG: helicase associated domain-containing protein [Brevibacterium sp.]
MGRGRVDFERGIARLSSYARFHGHASPKSDDVWLGWRVGLWVYHLRAKYRAGKLTEQQITAAKAIGVRFGPPYRDAKPKPPNRAQRQEAEMIQKLSLLDDYFAEHGHINVKQHDGVAGWPRAGAWISRLRSNYRKGSLSDVAIRTAEAMGIVWNPGPGHRWKD